MEQAALLRSGDLSAADIAHIAEEIESMGRSEKRELANRLTVLLTHLLRWEHQPARRGRSWSLSIDNTRDELAVLLRDNPSLKARLSEVTEEAYRRARRQAAIETGLDLTVFPLACPWSFDDAMRGG
jgi:hypothetical protein